MRDDLPSGLLIAVVVGMGQAMDSWLVTRQPDAEDLPQLMGGARQHDPRSVRAASCR